jgi:hypothetical protein
MTDASFLFVLLSLRSSIWLYEERFTTAMQAVFTILGHLSGSQLVIIVRCFSEEHHVSFFFLLFLFCGSEKNRFCISYFILVFSNGEERQEKLTSETVEGASLTFQSVDDVHRCHGFTFGVFRVGDGISDDIFQEHFQDSASFFVDQTGNTFHAATTSQSSDSGFRDALDVVTQDFAMTLRSSFSQSFASFTATGHLFRLFQLTQNTCTPRP